MREELLTALQMNEQMEIAGTLASIEMAVWLIAGLLILGIVLFYFRNGSRQPRGSSEQSGWQKDVELAYDKGKYDEALQALATAELFYPRSPLVRLWQGRCYFQKEAWAKAVEKFEECVRLEPWYRKSVKDWMAFIELNELVPGVEGYLVNQ
jgi:tetratricopeptide (TPR) repeat protein